jgi:hypothetical protein
MQTTDALESARLDGELSLGNPAAGDLGTYCGFFDEGDRAVIEFRHGEDVTVLPHVVVHSVRGFGWGYVGNGPSDAALAIVRHALRQSVYGVQSRDAAATALYRAFTVDVVVKLELNVPFSLPEVAVMKWLNQQK